MSSVTLSDYKAWPKEWKDDHEKARDNLVSFIADVRRRETYFDSIGLPCRRVATDADTELQPYQWVSLQAAKCTLVEDNLDTKYIILSREVSADQSGKEVVHKMMGHGRQGVDMVIVPAAEVAALKAQGWQVEYAPSPPLGIDDGYQDRRAVDRPVDVMTLDQPAKDTMRYLEHGNKFISSAMTKDNWRPGQLIGQNGSEPTKIAQSLSFAPPSSREDISERRSATSTGHMIHHKRPSGVSYGWGGYDRHVRWQSYGRRVTKDMVEKGDWPTDALAPIRFVNEAGEIVDTITETVDLEDPSPKRQKPITLHDKLNSHNGRKSKAREERNPEALAWPGTYDDDE